MRIFLRNIPFRLPALFGDQVAGETAAEAETVEEGVPCATTKVTFTAPLKAGRAMAIAPLMITTGTAAQVPSALLYRAWTVSPS